MKHYEIIGSNYFSSTEFCLNDVFVYIRTKFEQIFLLLHQIFFTIIRCLSHALITATVITLVIKSCRKIHQAAKINDLLHLQGKGIFLNWKLKRSTIKNSSKVAACLTEYAALKASKKEYWIIQEWKNKRMPIKISYKKANVVETNHWSNC